MKAPTGLGADGLELWTEVTEDHDLRPDEKRVLEDAAREADIIALMERERCKPTFSLVVKGSMGQEVINPLISELRQHRATLAQLLRQLKLTDENGVSARSTSARSAANTRWAKRGA
jgi:uncharacterized protein YejL (UPF0352 family)